MCSPHCCAGSFLTNHTPHSPNQTSHPTNQPKQSYLTEYVDEYREPLEQLDTQRSLTLKYGTTGGYRTTQRSTRSDGQPKYQTRCVRLCRGLGLGAAFGYCVGRWAGLGLGACAGGQRRARLARGLLLLLLASVLVCVCGPLLRLHCRSAFITYNH